MLYLLVLELAYYVMYMSRLDEFISSISELDSICAEILGNIQLLGDVSEFLESLNVSSVSDLIAKILLASSSTESVSECEACESGVEEDVEFSEDIRELSNEIEDLLRKVKLPHCVRLKRVVEHGKRR